MYVSYLFSFLINALRTWENEYLLPYEEILKTFHLFWVMMLHMTGNGWKYTTENEWYLWHQRENKNISVIEMKKYILFFLNTGRSFRSCEETVNKVYEQPLSAWILEVLVFTYMCDFYKPWDVEGIFYKLKSPNITCSSYSTPSNGDINSFILRTTVDKLLITFFNWDAYFSISRHFDLIISLSMRL